MIPTDAPCIATHSVPSDACAEPQTLPAEGDDARHRQRLAGLAGRDARRLRAAGIVLVLAGAATVAQAAAIAWIVQGVLVDGAAPTDMASVFGLLGAAIAVRVGLQWLAPWLAGSAADAISERVRVRVNQAIHARGPLWLRRQRAGALSALAVHHADALVPYHAGFVPVRLEVVAVPLLIAAVVAFVQPVVAAILVLTAPLVLVFMVLVGRGAEAAGRGQLRAMGRLGAHFGDRLRALGLLRVHGRGQAEHAAVHEAAEGLRVGSLRVLRIAFLSSTVLEFFASASVAAVALYLGLSLLGELHAGVAPSLGTALFCLLLAPEFYAPLRRLAAHYHDRANAIAAVAAIEDELEGWPTGLDAPIGTGAQTSERHARAWGDACGSPLIAMHQATLGYPGTAHPVLADFDVVLHAGERIALVGPSGCGKSTVLDALGGWLAPVDGTVLCQPGLRIGHAGARPYLFPGSIEANLRLADPTADAAMLDEAIRLAQVSVFADALPRGLATPIGERGHGLSGGQARRIALARLFLTRPDVVLLDEPTASLDPTTEAEVLAGLDAWLGDRALVIATHCEAALTIVDRVLDVETGQWRVGGRAARSLEAAA